MQHITELFCKIDDFCKQFEPILHQQMIEQCSNTRKRQTNASLSELMTIIVLFHQLRYRQFKMFYTFHVKGLLQREFPNMPSYNRFIELMPRCLLGLFAFFQTIKGDCSGVSIVDSTALAVCHNRRIHQHQVFEGHAARGKTSVDWFFGFKLHLVINHLGEIVDFRLTAGNINDRQPVTDLCQHVFGILVGDKGYLGRSLKDRLRQQGVELLTPVRRNMKEVNHTDFEKYLLKRRSLVETVIDELKNLCQIEHTRHRSMMGFLVNLMGGLVAYCLSPNKPKLPLSKGRMIENLMC